MEVKQVKVWKCAGCGSWESSMHAAQECCSPDTVYKCDGCGKTYDDEERAQKCCKPVCEDRWECKECGDSYKSKADALVCCCVNNGVVEDADDEEEE